MPLTIRAFAGGPLATNAYFVLDREQSEALIIDAPYDVADALISEGERASAKITMIVLTHAHWDHVGDAAELQSRTGAPLIAHPAAIERLAEPGSALYELPTPIPPVTPDRLVNDGDTLELGDHLFTVMYLPGHDNAHIALYSEPDRVFLGGDVLFPGGHGRVDIPGSDPKDMEHSLARLVDLPPDTVVYPGHGATTTIGAEAWLQTYRGR
jgi:glyoxylase-like metal-dependent hydrolase (beta-lactamase superfamily II)